MKPWKTLERAQAPGGGELVLAERDGEFAIRVDGKELMSSRASGSEIAMAGAALEGKGPNKKKVLLGGLGLGFTLRATLDRVPPGSQVVVAELSEAVVRWNKEHLSHLAGRPLDDPRVKIETRDVLKQIRATTGEYDAILLDVDNGPIALTAAANASLYAEAGITSCRSALRPRGTLVVWSAGPDERYLARLQRGGFEAQARTVNAHGSAGRRHTLFVAHRR